ncbi:hypothetical protein GF389_00545 [Candidatus Dojkabacteria bacterium]|nr:hypothetical protein [Candidatus Dojkabacteria bacterium]
MLDFLNSIIIGILITAPVGPTTILCINRTLVKGRLSGLISGMGASTADFIFGVTVILSLGLIIDIMDKYQNTFILMSSLILAIIGYTTFKSKTNYFIETKHGHRKKMSIIGDFFTTFSAMITNPITIILFTSLLPSYGLIPDNSNLLEGTTVALGIFSGGMIWWTGLVFITSKLKNKIIEQYLSRMNQVTGLLIILFSLLNLLQLF